MKRALAASIAACLLSPLLASAEEAKAPPPPKWYDTFEVHGLVDTYYGANLSQGQTNPNLLRAFDAVNGFQVAYTKLTAQLAPSDRIPAGFRLDLGFGPVADAVAYKNVQQAYVTLPVWSLTLDLGRFSTPMGAEVIEAKDNWLYTRSLAFFWAIPFTHTGARVTAPLFEGLTLAVALTNGWDVPSASTPAGPEKTGLLSLVYAGASNLLLAANLSYGKEPGAAHEKTVIDLVAGRSFGDLSLNLNFDYGTQKTDVTGGTQTNKWTAVSLMARYAFMGDKFRLAGRFEYFDDPQNFRMAYPLTDGATGAKYQEFTLGLSVPFGGNAELRAEYRYDKADKVVLAGTSKSQSTATVAALAWF